MPVIVYLENMATKNKSCIELFQNWKEKVLVKVNEKITKLRQKENQAMQSIPE